MTTLKLYVGIIGPTIYSVGYDNDFIIIKRYYIDYYIIPLKNKISDDIEKNKIGPMSYNDYKLKRKEMNISDSLKFTIFPKY